MAAIDKYEQYAHLPVDSARNAFTITPSDSLELPYITRAIYVGGTPGDISVVMANGQTVVFQAAQSGSVLPFAIRQVKLTGTTATTLIGLY